MTETEHKLKRDLQLALNAAKQAAECVKNHFGAVKDIETKSQGRGIVTAADKEAEEIILQHLRSNSHYAVLSEEAGHLQGTGGPKWVIDPLDGTTNFAAGLPLFAVSIALVEGSNLLLGVIVHPLTGEAFWAEKGTGAFKNGIRLWRKDKQAGEPPVIFTDHGYDRDSRRLYSTVTARLVEDCYLRSLGASTVELCRVAEGSGDAFVCAGDELWDVAAGLLIAREAGYLISDWQGKEWQAEGDYELVAHPAFHRMLTERLGELQR